MNSHQARRLARQSQAAAAREAKTGKGDGEANRAIRFGLFFDNVPVLRKSQADFSEIAVDSVAMVRLDANGESFAGNQLATIGDSIESDAGDKNERGIDLFTLAVNALEERLDRSRSLAGERRQRNLVELFVRGDQEIGRSLPIEAQGGIARGTEGSINGTHQGIDALVA